MKIIPRDIPPRSVWTLEQAGIHPLLARLYAARGVTSTEELDDALGKLLPPSGMLGTDRAALLLADAMAQNQRLCVVADYDCDGATACAVALRGLRLLGARNVSYLVPDRVVDGYGLTAPIAQRVKDQGADVLITVDNGIASVEGVAKAKALGLQVLVTDHHLPAATLPQADVIVNPNQPGCPFESKSIAGVGVMFYVLLALRAELRQRGVFDAATQPKLDALLPLVALGTVADVVKLDANNRRLVAQGLKRVRALAMPAGLASLFVASGRNASTATTFDFGFALGPRINAAGRLADMTLGIECLLTDDPARADELARMLDGINRERRVIEGDMREQAMMIAESLFDEGDEPPPAICVFDPDFHEGVVGIVASRIKDKLHRPAFVFAASAAPGKEHELKGSGRSIPGFHLRDALDLVAKRYPGVLLRFGGHAMAAGCTINEERLDDFEQGLRGGAGMAGRRHPHPPPGHRWPTGAAVPAGGPGGHPAQGSVGPGLRRTDLQRGGGSHLPAPGRREAPAAQTQTPGHARRWHLVRPYRATAFQGHAGVPAGCRRMERRAPGALSGRRGRGMKHLTLLTGASRGMGLAMAQQLLGANARLLCLSRHTNAALEQEAARTGTQLEQWTVDLADSAPVAERVRLWLQALDPATLASATLINNAGVISELVPLCQAQPDDLAHALRVGLEAPMALTAAFLSATQTWQLPRKVLNISSGLGRRAMASSSAYCAAKAGMDHFTRCLALEEALVPHGVKVCSLAPGVIDTDMQSQLRSADASSFPDQSAFASLHSNGQLTSTEDAARRVLAYLQRTDFGDLPVADVRG